MEVSISGEEWKLKYPGKSTNLKQATDQIYQVYHINLYQVHVPWVGNKLTNIGGDRNNPLT
jgi:hypothetical protein